MRSRTRHVLVLVALTTALAATGAALAGKGKDPFAAWKPKFDPSGARYVMKLSSVAHPAMECISVGYRIRDKVWERTGGKLYIDYYPMSQLGGEVEVLNQLVMGAVQGMLCSSVVAPTLGPRMGVLNLPFLINSWDKLDRFVRSGNPFEHMLAAMESKGIVGVDVVGYGSYGWATTRPVRTFQDAKALKFRIAEAAVNKSIYRAWGLNAVVMPWPDVHIALKQGVIDGLDHTPTVCQLTRKFEVARYFTRVDYAQGLLIQLINRDWLDSLPPDVRQALIETIHEECADTRRRGRAQEERAIAKAEADGVRFFRLPREDMDELRRLGNQVHREWTPRIGGEYLAEVQHLVGYKAGR